MKIKALFLTVSLFIFSLFSSCVNDDDNVEECIAYVNPYVTSVNAPSTGMVNEIVSIEVNFDVINGCGSFNQFIETENGNTTTIEVEAKYEGCVCTAVVLELTTTYEFMTDTPGDYELKFKSGATEFITVNLTIN